MYSSIYGTSHPVCCTLPTWNIQGLGAAPQQLANMKQLFQAMRYIHQYKRVKQNSASLALLYQID